jgi:hypothetical protein
MTNINMAMGAADRGMAEPLDLGLRRCAMRDAFAGLRPIIERLLADSRSGR